MSEQSTATPMPADLFGKVSPGQAKREYQARQAGLEPCTTCGRGVKPGSGFITVVIGGGASCAHPDDETIDENDPGYMGAWVLGPECGKKIDPKSRKIWNGWNS